MDLNPRMEVLRHSKATFIMRLNETTANLNSDRQETAETEDERVRLEHEYKAYRHKCKVRTEWIFLQDFCSYLVVRTQLMGDSKVSPPYKIVDRDITPSSLASAACPATMRVPTGRTSTDAEADRCRPARST